MQSSFRPHIRFRWPCLFCLGLWLVALIGAPGCSKEKQKSAPSVSKPPTMHLIYPQQKRISHIVGQPSFVQSYERTSIFPKVTAFIQKWNVDIGDKVQKGDVLADLFVPELRENWETKKAEVQLEKERVALALKMVKVAEAEVKAAEWRLAEAQRILDDYKAAVDRWEVQDVRLSREVRRAVVDPQVLTETQHQHRSAVARWEAQKATIAKADAELLAKRASLEAAIVDVAVDRARVAVAASEAKRLEAWVGYLKLFAPYDGIVVERNVNTWDFVLPQTGDPTAMIRSPHLSPSGQAAPVYVIDRTDIVRIYVDVPERDADYVHIGSEARVKIWAYRDEWMPASVTRISWALNPKSRTMRAEIDLPNPNSKILPGMYAYGKIIVDRPDIRVLPRTAVTHAGGKSFVWLYEDGRAQRTEIRTGLQEGKWIEVITRRLKTESEDEDKWEPFNGSEHVLMGHKISTLTEGTHVEISDAPAPIEGVSDSEKDNSM